MSLSRTRRIATPALVLITALAAPLRVLPAQDESNTSRGFVLESGEHHLREVVRSAARFLGRTYVTSTELEQDSARIEVQKKLNLDAIGCEEVLSQLLYVRGFAVVPVDALRGIYEVVSLRGPRSAEVVTSAEYMSPDEVLKRASWKVYVLTSVPLTHLDANRAAQQLRPFHASSGSRMGLVVGNAGSSSSVLLQGFASQVARAIRLLRAIDVPQQDPLPAGYRERLAEVEQVMKRQHNAMQALQKRIADLEAQLAVIGGGTRRK